MKVAIASDHNGVEFKKEIIKYLKNQKIEILDLSPSNSSIDDYPDYAFLVGENVSKKNADYGILICGTGIGMCIAANKVKGIRCSLINNTNDAYLSREHNNANVIAVGTKGSLNDTLKMIDIFIHTNFSNEERHSRRINKITKYEMSK